MSGLEALGRTPRRGAVVGAVVGGALLVAPSAAPAMVPCDAAGNPCPSGPKSAPGRVDVNAGYTLTVRRGPRSAARKVRKLKDGAAVRIVCQTNGEQTSGTFGTSRLWDKLARGGYVSDTFVNTGSDGRVAPTCPPRGAGRPQHHTQPTEPAKGRPRDVRLTDDYPFKTASPEAADKWGFYYRECTSFVAYRLNRMKNFRFSNRMQGGHFGDAGHWDDNARALGFRVDDRPTVGSVMVRDSGTWGHVAVVAKVEASRFLIEEYNHEVSHGYSQRWISRSTSSPDWDHFIHFRR